MICNLYPECSPNVPDLITDKAQRVQPTFDFYYKLDKACGMQPSAGTLCGTFGIVDKVLHRGFNSIEGSAGSATRTRPGHRRRTRERTWRRAAGCTGLSTTCDRARSREPIVGTRSLAWFLSRACLWPEMPRQRGLPTAVNSVNTVPFALSPLELTAASHAASDTRSVCAKHIAPKTALKKLNLSACTDKWRR